MTEKTNGYALQLFEPEPEAVYTIDTTARLAQTPRRTVLLYCKSGFITPAAAPESSGYHFNEQAIRALRRIDELRSKRGINLAGIRIILDLLNQVERLQREVRFLRQ